ncbi:MAG: tRNA-dihydrouridine synthase family protein [Desulfatitalea sp.]|nr:tRNA-dihydrouridine synthase family protein [Desulfatitalea sp.]NNK02507.1 tRNA-dihydrouridine synthase family protein [Desulfatitalea sp.]
MNSSETQICLAPLRGLTGTVFRETYAQFYDGIDYAVAPFLTTTHGGRVKPSHLQEVLPGNNRRMPVIPQILSKDAERFITLARALYDLGYDTVNWNMGCPFPRVAKKGRGSGLLGDPERIAVLLDQIMAAIPNRLSIKARLGWRDAQELLAVIKVLNAYPIHRLIIHARTGIQMYKGSVDLDSFEHCLSICRCPVAYNGDITTTADYRWLQCRWPGLKTWMIGRGVLQDPFLPADIKGLPNTTESDRRERFRCFHDALLERFARVRSGPGHLVNTMKGYWTFFAVGFEDGGRMLKVVRKADTLRKYHTAVDRFFDAPFRSIGPAVSPNCKSAGDPPASLDEEVA